MHVSGIKMQGFMGHADSSVKLPPQGIVTVRGPNGAGKSAIIEAVSVALWGKTLRGTSPWSAPMGEVSVSTIDGPPQVTHRRGPRSSTIEIAGQPDFETASKAKEYLETVCGPWDLWRRSRVFSSADGAAFTGATDAERKRLLEAVLGLDRFDAALDACRRDLRKAEAVLSLANSAKALAENDLRHAREALAVIAAQRATPGDLPPDVLRARIQDATIARDDAAKERETASARASAASDQVAGQRALVREADAKIAAGTASICGACGQAVQPSLGAEMVATAKRDRNDAALACHRAEQDKIAARAEEQACSQRMNALAQEVGDLRARLRAAVTGAENMEAARAAAQERHDAATDAVMEAEDALAIAAWEDQQLRACDKVLGVRGVRARVLGRALEGLAQISNEHLARLFPERAVTVSFTPPDDGKGAPSDKIPMLIEGAGGGEGYHACSGGERRRIDVAVGVLALGALADASAGTASTAGTVFCDEVFDALDAEGQDAVVEVLTELAADRAVVVISHAPDLLARLPAVMELLVEAGSVKEIA